MSFLAALQYGRSVVDRVAGSCFRIEGHTAEYTGNWRSYDRSTQLAMGGLEEDVSGSIVCSLSQFHVTQPANGKRLYHGNRSYRIVQVDADSTSYTLTLGSVNK